MPGMTQLTVRRARPGDLDALVAHVRAGFDSYRTFMPPAWSPPAMDLERPRMAELLEEPSTCTLVAEAAAAPVGHISFFPARQRSAGEGPGGWRERPLVPGLAHVWQLFVLPGWWGRGVGPLLHERALEAMRERGFEAARLYAFAGQARARAFYERRGWVAVGALHSPELDADLVEYRLARL
jgi:GNAT superfamily N-acetyltransferase